MARPDPRLVSPLLMWAAVLAGCAALLAIVPRAALPLPRFLWILAIPAAVNWLCFFPAAVRENGRAALSAAQTRRLATGSVYSAVLHPIYSADIILA